MGLANLLNVPQNQSDWSLWGFAHRVHHDQIREAIQAQYNVPLQSYPIDPINLDQIQNFLDYNQQAHNDFNGVLGLRGNDLEEVNLNDRSQLQSWIYLHYQEHLSAGQMVKVS
jgi:hypothetical protein